MVFIEFYFLYYFAKQTVGLLVHDSYYHLSMCFYCGGVEVVILIYK